MREEAQASPARRVNLQPNNFQDRVYQENLVDELCRRSVMFKGCVFRPFLLELGIHKALLRHLIRFAQKSSELQCGRYLAVLRVFIYRLPLFVGK